MSKTLVGGIVGGLIVFIWGAISHMVLPLGEAGIQMIPDEDAVVGVLKTSLPNPGVYIFPGMEMKKDPTEAEQKAWAEKYRTGPTGLLVIRSGGEEAISPKMLATEFVSNVAGALVAAFLLAKIGGSYGARVVAVALLGLFGWLALSISYWNWYGFSTPFIVGEGIDQVLGWTFAGLGLAKIVKPTAATAAGAA
jgi:hypothetical protein